MEIAVIDETGELNSNYKTELEQIIKLVLSKLEISSDREICLTFIDDIKMRELNSSYRGIDRTTDVLSFPQTDGPDFSLLGDLIISLPTARRHSKIYGITLQEEIKKLIVHGILHLLGHDHKKKKEAEIMSSREEELLSYIQGS